MMNLKPLPRRLNCTSLELGLLLAILISKNKGHNNIGDNIKVEDFDDAAIRRNFKNGENKGVVLAIYDDSVSCYADGNYADEPTVTSLHDFIEKYGEPPLTVGEYDVRVDARRGGIDVGCTFVSWDMMRRLAKLIPLEKVSPGPARPPDAY